MKVIKVEPHGFASNSYILTADGKRAVVIDCAQTHLYSVCERERLVPEYVLLTHGHFDHVGGCGKFCKEGAKICCGKDEAPLVFSEENRGLFGGVYIPDFEIAKTFSDGDEVELCGINIKVISTPGHTAGGVCYLAEGCLFTGDTLFKLGAGRCDLPTGNYAQLLKSIKKLGALDGDFKVYCGHDDDTTLDFERKNNPYFKV